MNQLGDYTAPAATRVRGYGAGRDQGRRRRGVRRLTRRAARCGRDRETAFRKRSPWRSSPTRWCWCSADRVRPRPTRAFWRTAPRGFREVREDSEFDKESGEGYDRARLDLAGVQVELLQELKARRQAGGRGADSGPAAEDPEGGGAGRRGAARLVSRRGGRPGGGRGAVRDPSTPGASCPSRSPRTRGSCRCTTTPLMPRANYVDWPAAPQYPFGYGLELHDVRL